MDKLVSHPGVAPGSKVVVLMPAYRAGGRILKTFARIPRDMVDEVLIGDDASPDNTYELAKTLPARAWRNQKNLGYGGNMKVCLQKALETNGDIFVEIHADGQYDPAIIPHILQALRPGDGMLLGSRLMHGEAALAHGMSWVKLVVNIILTAIANMVLGTHLTEFQSGFRVYTRPFLETIDIEANSNDHLFSFETILQALYFGFTVAEVPVVCTYEAGVTQMDWRKGAKYIMEMLWALVRFRLAKAGKHEPVFSPKL